MNCLALSPILLLVDAEGIILELLKRVVPDDGSRRTLLPGHPYQAPLQPAHRDHSLTSP